MKTHIVKPKKQQICLFCNKEYKDRRILNRHLKICKKKPSDHIPIKSEKVEDMCLISTSHDDLTIKQELTGNSVNEDFIQNV